MSNICSRSFQMALITISVPSCHSHTVKLYRNGLVDDERVLEVVFESHLRDKLLEPARRNKEKVCPILFLHCIHLLGTPFNLIIVWLEYRAVQSQSTTSIYPLLTLRFCLDLPPNRVERPSWNPISRLCSLQPELASQKTVFFSHSKSAIQISRS